MVQLLLPKNSRIKAGKVWPRPEGATRLREFRVYRWDPEDGRNPRLFITATARRSINLVHREWHELMDRAEVSDANLAVALSTIEALSFAVDHQTRRNG